MIIIVNPKLFCPILSKTNTSVLKSQFEMEKVEFHSTPNNNKDGPMKANCDFIIRQSANFSLSMIRIYLKSYFIFYFNSINLIIFFTQINYRVSLDLKDGKNWQIFRKAKKSKFIFFSKVNCKRFFFLN